MLKLKSLLKSNLFLFVATIAFFAVCPQDVWAAEGSVFEKVRDKAASSLKDIKLVVYILAGFGLIGFSFMAIFNKISWKWFANIAISLFLLSVMGLFIDDFTGTSKHSTLLDYGNYLSGDGGVEGTGGTIGGGQVSEEGEKDPAKTQKEQSEQEENDKCEGIDVARCDKSPDACYASNYCEQYRKKIMGGGSSSGGTTGTGGASGTNQSNGTNDTSNAGSDNSGNGNNLSAQNNNGTGNQKTTGDLQPVWNPETQSYELPNIDVFGDKNLANNNPVSGLGNIGGGTPNVDDLNKDLQNMVNNVNSAQGGNAADNKQEGSGGWLNDLWNKGKEEAKKKAEEEAKKALEKAKQEALNAAKDTVSGVGILDKTGLDDKINAEIDKAGNKVNTDNWVDGAKDKFGWNEETSERNGEDNIGGALDAGKIPGTEGVAPDVDALNQELQNMVNGTGNASASDYGWNEETSERNGYDSEPSGADIQPVWDPETQSYVLPEVEVVGDAGASHKPLPGTQGSTPDVDALNQELQNMVNGTGNASASDYGWNEETSERNGYDSEPSGADIQPVWDPETQSYVLPEVEVVGDAGASYRPLPGTQGATPDVDALNQELQNMVNGTGNASASDYGWNEETSERNGYNADGTQGSSSNSNYGWNEETSEGRGWGG